MNLINMCVSLLLPFHIRIQEKNQLAFEKLSDLTQKDLDKKVKTE